ncbi:bifunctional D-glycero-beta-D-manno-heptose-7-phosphate kinase/D-glycero-beta-D-manno-heptose 1-phosphate adenylyltransferase HldE [Variovorax sp. J22P240]|nr:bifunctional D-glycero-beta-D-manno-heptose-7-phosphate kinase/D-glycero-beta-D-manno-heptose 1-phosphate adenylyltransferase HldE [Variovorax sp. J22P240]MDL9999603.1 bifunctional D-glycero-beta-D-manno-heptose-7-phosphate kinase/D-glycero-beta-D-manno-heptose 1-phosphate adenylyltransferase HldE [Variovorax sp. J22P240]
MHQPSPTATKPRILVVGDIMLDRYVIGEVSRISPEAPVPVLAAKHEENRPGGAANVAANISAMGGNATLLAVVGEDSASAELDTCLQRFQVTPLFVKDPQGGTTQKTRLVAGAQQIARVDRDVYPTPQIQQRLLDEYERQVGTYDLVVLSDYAKGTLDNLPEFLDAAARLGVPTLVDPKRVTPEFYRGAFLLKPNNSEFVGLFGAYASDQELVAKARDAIESLRLEHLVITRGAKGMVIVSAGGRADFVPTRARDVFDVSGAGDTVLAALAMELSARRSISDAVQRANIAAGIAVSHPGTYVVSEDEIEAEVNASTHEHPKVLTEDQLKVALVNPRMHGKKVVFTNGCFDILHPGHVRLLKAARALGDILVLGLNSDDSVRKLKGPGRPINNFSHRAEVLAGLSSVDYIVEFDAPTPLETIQYVLPDILVKGGDYPVADIVGYSEVTARGGQVIALDFHDGYSTTRIVNEINKTRKS